jgi:membrane protease YdiL (CAAX protease family)
MLPPLLRTTPASQLNSFIFPLINGAVLAGCAFFSYPGQAYVLTGLMLFLPLLDRRWNSPAIDPRAINIAIWAILVITTGSLLAWQPQYVSFAASTLLFAALPEEWFFRAYFMTRLGTGWQANLITSLVFALLHGLAWGPATAILVFIPSLLFGWLYQRRRDLILLVLVHALSNLVYILILPDLPTWLKPSAV